MATRCILMMQMIQSALQYSANFSVVSQIPHRSGICLSITKSLVTVLAKV